MDLCEAVCIRFLTRWRERADHNHHARVIRICLQARRTTKHYHRARAIRICLQAWRTTKPRLQLQSRQSGPVQSGHARVSWSRRRWAAAAGAAARERSRGGCRRCGGRGRGSQRRNGGLICMCTRTHVRARMVGFPACSRTHTCKWNACTHARVHAYTNACVCGVAATGSRRSRLQQWPAVDDRLATGSRPAPDRIAVLQPTVDEIVC